MSLRIIEGGKGGGKTVYATHLAYLAFRHGRNVFANYRLEFPHSTIDEDTFTTPEGREKLTDCVIVVDEAHNYFGARDFMSASNKAADKFQRQIRKRKCDVILTTQQAIAVDIAFRRNLEIMDECFPYHQIQMEDGSIGLRKATLWEIEHKKIDRILIKETLYWAETSTQPAPVKWIKFNPTPYFGMYDSDEFVDF
jgi:hypothetical protein